MRSVNAYRGFHAGTCEELRGLAGTCGILAGTLRAEAEPGGGCGGHDHPPKKWNCYYTLCIFYEIKNKNYIYLLARNIIELEQ
jgi:hypothetical protein